MSDDLTARIEALEARGYKLADTRSSSFITETRGGLIDPEWLTTTRAELLTALEQAVARITKYKAWMEEYEATVWAPYAMANTIGAARLKLAEQKYAELAMDLIDEAVWRSSACDRAEEAEAALGGYVIDNEALKADLAAERAKWCV